MWSTLHADISDRAFDKLAGPTARAMTAAAVTADRQRLRATLVPIKYFVDKRIAHHNPDHDPALTVGDERPDAA